MLIVLGDGLTLAADKDAGLNVVRDLAKLPASSQMALSYNDAVEKIQDSVVTVFTEVPLEEADNEEDSKTSQPRFDLGNNEEEPVFRTRGNGSGIIISPLGYVLTNHHVVANADSITVRLKPSDEELPAVVVGGDPVFDLALLKIDAPGLVPATLADSSLVRVGDVVLALGSPFGLEQTLTMGVVSATGRSTLGLIRNGMEDFIQTDAAINPGNSGGPLMDGLGRVVGVNTARFMGENIGFAIPINLALKVAEDLLKHGIVVRGYLGIRHSELNLKAAKKAGVPAGRMGIIINDVLAESPADKAGFQPGDVVLEVNGRSIRSGDHLQMLLASQAPQAEVLVTGLRDGKGIKWKVVLGDPPELENFKAQTQPAGMEVFPGLRVVALTNALRIEWQLTEVSGNLVLIAQDYPTGNEKELLKVGDQLLAINGKPVSTVDQVKKLFAVPETTRFMLKIVSKGKTTYHLIKRS
jgi:S1-C subfamily serine protease